MISTSKKQRLFGFRGILRTFINAKRLMQLKYMIDKKRGIAAVVLALFLLLALPAFADVSGCYVYPEGREDLYCVPNTLDTEAQADCNNYDDCSLSEHFIPGSSCVSIPECQQVTCNVDCQTHAQGKCQQRGGEAVPQDQYDLWCSPGCCKISNLFCQFNLNLYQCQLRTEQLGANPNLMTFANPVGLTLQQCNEQYCLVEVQTARLNGIITDGSAPLAGAAVTLEGRSQQTISAGNGFYEFNDLAPGSLLLHIQKSGYTPLTRTISLSPGQYVNQNFTLAPLGNTIAVTGRVTYDGQAVSGATVSWQGSTAGQTFTDGVGNYNIPELPAGQYLITVSKAGYVSQEQDIIAATEDITLPFVLTATTLSGVRGVTNVDFNNDGEGQPTYGVRLYANGIFKGYSQYPGGYYQLDLPAGEYQLVATYQDYAAEESISIGTAPVVQNIHLIQYVGECTLPNPLRDVASFTSEPVTGLLQVRLQWAKPCAEVIGYTIEKKATDVVIETISASPAQNILLDSQVEWGQTYTYSIKTIYGQGVSPNALETTITMGSEDCEGRYQQSRWDTFCRTGTSEIRKTVWTCNAQNVVVPSLNCADRDGTGQDYYCAQLTPGNAECKDAGMCSTSGDPFGLYYSLDMCYGTSNTVDAPYDAPNYCYYDYSDSVVDQCKSCLNVESCFDYRSQDACNINNCLSDTCIWINGASNSEPLIDYGLINLPVSITPETGQGYCAEEKYNDDDQCALCSASATLFENNYCTAQVCTSLGRCFANAQVSSCNSCGDVPSADANCYTYSTELECTAHSGIQKTLYGDITLSQDRCGWGRCSWQGEVNGFSGGSCVKDADANEQDDCASFTSSGELRACRIDNAPPKTKLVPAGVPIVSLVTPNVTFEGDDSHHLEGSQRNKMGLLGYCVASADSQAPSLCTQYTEVFYLGNTPHELVTVNILDSITEQINGKTYRIKFYSKDKYKNQEPLQEAFIVVDNIAPEFDIQDTSSTVGDRTTLTAYLVGTSEAMGCFFALTPILPLRPTQTHVVGREEQNKEATFTDLSGILYNLSVTCKDDPGNEQIHSKLYTFDQEERIAILEPAMQSAIASRNIQFKMSTVAGARCELYTHNQKVADFISDEEGKMHQTLLLPGFIEREYAAEYKAVCYELLTDEAYEDYFHFTVDFTPPQTQIVLREASREERPTEFGWETSFIREAGVEFECAAAGFACDKTFYCLGEGCENVANAQYQEYTSTIPVTASTLICYYSTDTAANVVYAPACGTILIEGYGLVLENPSQHYYENEQWGISNAPVFDLSFFTKVPTQECRFDVVSGFPYNFVPAFKVLLPNTAGRYTFAQFPTAAGLAAYSEEGDTKTIYVVCKDGAGDLGPEQKINLEYDPSIPEITAAYARPNPVLEGNTVTLFIDTDDKTICKFSDAGHTEYAQMNFAFPGGEAELGNIQAVKELQEHHQAAYTINSFLGLVQPFNITAQCRNGADDLSEAKTIEFTVDYSQLGGILSFFPDQTFSTAFNMSFAVETSKNAICTYRVNGTPIIMSGAGSRTHSASRNNLAEGYYQFPFSCQIGEHAVEEAFTFTIDRTMPSITSINDGEYSCGENISLMVYTNEQNITFYSYELYDAGETPEAPNPANLSSFQSFSYLSYNQSFPARGTKIAQGTLPAQLPLQIATNITPGHRYFARVKAEDAAGNVGQFSESDGVRATAANDSICTDDQTAPEILLVANESCTASLLEIHCSDQTGCGQILYGTHASALQCNPVLPYNGAKISFTASGWLCYIVKDAAGNNISGTRAVTLADTDGDGIANICDACDDTIAGKISDAQGCAVGEVPAGERMQDTDSDGLPDYWEKMYDQEQCQLNYVVIDSNDNAMADTSEDYDADGTTNYQEYIGRSDPCVADELQSEETAQNRTFIPSSTRPETGNVLAWVLLIMGLLLTFGGIGYLVYYYNYAPTPNKRAVPAFESVSFGPVADEGKVGEATNSWQDKLFKLKKEKAEKNKTRQRLELFQKFGKGSPSIPHLTDVIKAKPSLPKLQQLAEKYVEHKEDIQPGLRPEEKSIFAKLEGIAKQTKEKKINEVVNTKDAESIFEKLKEISRKRKEK